MDQQKTEMQRTEQEIELRKQMEQALAAQQESEARTKAAQFQVRCACSILAPGAPALKPAP